MKRSPAELYEKTGGGDAYRVAMLDHGYVVPTSPWFQKKRGSKELLQCGLTHEQNWSEWRRFSDEGGEYEGRWCRTCATVQSREVPAPERRD